MAKLLGKDLRVRVSRSMYEQISRVAAIHDAPVARVTRALLWISLRGGQSKIESALKDLDYFDIRG